MTAWGRIIATTGSLANTVGANQPFRYRGYVYDEETGFYYLQSRYYDPTTCRFISADVLLSTGQGVIGHNSFAYCRNNCVTRSDVNGLKDEQAKDPTIYVIYYQDDENGHQDQAFNSWYYDANSPQVKIIPVHTAKDFVTEWNNLSGNSSIDYLYIMVHGGEGKLYFKDSEISFSKGETPDNYCFEDLKQIKVKKVVRLLSCKGGAGDEGNNVALELSGKTDCVVHACTGKVSYTKIFGKYFARKSAQDWGIIKSFYKGKKSKSWPGQWCKGIMQLVSTI